MESTLQTLELQANSALILDNDPIVLAHHLIKKISQNDRKFLPQEKDSSNYKPLLVYFFQLIDEIKGGSYSNQSFIVSIFP